MVSREAIKALREKSGVSISKCKEALEACDGDFDKSIDYLRRHGILSAKKRMGRAANEGTILSSSNEQAIAIAELSAETDFVVKNDHFIKFHSTITELLLSKRLNSVRALLDEQLGDCRVEDAIRELVSLIGENISVKRVLYIGKSPNHSYGIYSHMGGSILSIVELTIPGLDRVAYDLAMHVAASGPLSINRKDLNSEIIDRERSVIAETLPSGKPPELLKKIVDGKMTNFYKENCLEEQPYIKDSSITVSQFLKSNGGASIKTFLRWQLGDK